jgi:hypothetical protein
MHGRPQDIWLCFGKSAVAKRKYLTLKGRRRTDRSGSEV